MRKVYQGPVEAVNRWFETHSGGTDNPTIYVYRPWECPSVYIPTIDQGSNLPTLRKKGKLVAQLRLAGVTFEDTVENLRTYLQAAIEILDEQEFYVMQLEVQE